MKSLNKEYLDSLWDNGFVKIKKFFDDKLISSCKKEIEELVVKDRFFNHLSISPKSVHIHNFFLHSVTLRKLLFGIEMQSLHKDVFGVSYCLRNAVASNSQIIQKDDYTFATPIGHEWHRDTPQFYTQNGDSQVLGKNFTYQVCIAIDTCDDKNSTKVLMNSHKESEISGHHPNTSDVKILEKKYSLKNVTMNAGDIAIIDDNIFHKVGIATKQSRWILFCSYTPWYVKPYFNFSSIELPEITEYEKHCLHKTSSPPPPMESVRNTFQLNKWPDKL